MSIEATMRVWNQSQQKGTSLLVMLALANWADENFISWPSVGAIAEKARTGHRNVQKILKELEGDKEIEIVGSHFRGVHKYKIILAAPTTSSGMAAPETGGEPQCTGEPQFMGGVVSDAETAPISGVEGEPQFRGEPQFTGEPQFMGGVNSSSQGGELQFAKGCPPVHPTLKDTKVDTKGDTKKAPFQIFKNAYPDRGGLPQDVAASEKLFHSLVADGVDPDDIIDGARAYALALKSEKKRETVRTMLTFLRKETWKDYQTGRNAYAQIGDNCPPEVAAMWRAILKNWPDQSAAKSWLYPLELEMVGDGGGVVFKAPSSFHLQRVQQNYLPALNGAWAQHLGGKASVVFRLEAVA